MNETMVIVSSSPEKAKEFLKYFIEADSEMIINNKYKVVCESKNEYVIANSNPLVIAGYKADTLIFDINSEMTHADRVYFITSVLKQDGKLLTVRL